MQYVNTANAPAAIGPYSQALCHNDLIFTSGQIPMDPVSGEIIGTTIEEQTEYVLRNLLAVLEAGGSGGDRILKTTCFLADMNDYPKFNAVYSKYITNNPARSCVAVRELPKSILVEVEAVAVKG